MRWCPLHQSSNKSILKVRGVPKVTSAPIRFAMGDETGLLGHHVWEVRFWVDLDTL